MEAIANHRRVELFGSTSMATDAKKEPAVAAEASPVQYVLARASFRSASDVSYKGRRKAEPAIIIAVAPAERRRKSQPSWTLQFQ